MSKAKLFELNDEINHFFNTQPELKDDVRFKNRVLTSATLEAEWKDKNNLSRELRVGIIGRVKAGKSSLLNALLFNGESVLPQAATPMTAALTVMKYGDKEKAEVDFYTNDDIEKLEADSRLYEQELKKAIEANIIPENEANSPDSVAQLSENDSSENENHGWFGNLGNQAKNMGKKVAQQMRKNNPEYRQQIIEAFNQANPILVAAHQQVEAMHAHPLSMSERKTMQTLTANSHQELMQKLNDYVGAAGKYMPYTKSVTLYLKEESLKDLEVIDTPGVNDPVASREERTHEFLKQCDVVFVVSPSAQFISNEDLALMQRVTVNEGIQEVYLVASQVDNDMCTPSEGGNGGSPTVVLEKIAQKLTHQAERALNGHKVLSQNSNLRALFEKHQVICTSSMAFNMLKNFSNKASWQGNIATVWKNLTHYYRDYLTSDATAKHHLEKMANIAVLKTVLDEVRANKDKIRASNQDTFIETKKTNMLALLDDVNDHFDEMIMKVETTSSAEAEAQLDSIKRFQHAAKREIDAVYRRAIYDIVIENGWAYKLDITTDNSTKAFFDVNQITEQKKTREVRNDASFWNCFGLFAGTHKESYTVVTINATQVNDAIQTVRNDVTRALNAQIGSLKIDWENDLIREVMATIRECNREVGGERLRRSEINAILRELITNLPIRKIQLADNIPDTIKNRSGNLSGSDAMRFNTEAKTYICDQLIQNLKHANANYVTDLAQQLEAVKLGTDITFALQKQAEELDKAIKNQKEYITRYQRIRVAAQQLSNKVNQAL
ncbi:dynamin family protein [Actinobacillus delphinicola]|uniref:Predicted GTPase n=1 Tax=Actinobacillus delphinicola TaxID=51161 RepID=A0A448TVW4_9PAST|nr:dynamin family protein [Actinobacillus delphinicola]VEJ10067.1 Predicted GTPase [Actinobacillus delphinicola]